MLLCCAIAVDLNDGADARSERYGAVLAESFAALAVTPLLQQDRIALGLLSKQAAELPGVSGITIYGIDSQILAMTNPAPAGRTFAEPIERDGNVVGYLNLTLSSAFLSDRRLPLWLLICCLILPLPWLLPVLLQGFNQTGRLLSSVRQPSPPSTPAPRSTATAQQPAYLLLANLLNELSLSTADSQALVADAIAIGREVVDLYGGVLEPLSGASIALWFDDQDSDAGFRAACAGLLLARTLRGASSTGVFRLGLHYAADRSSATRPVYLSDAALLAAAAGDGEVMLSHAVSTRLDGAERLRTEPIVHPLGADFATTNESCERLRGLNGAHEALLAEQSSALLVQRDDATI